VGRFDGFKDGVRRAAGGKAAAGDLVGRVKLVPGWMARCEKALRVADLNLAAAEDNGEIVTELVEGGLIIAGADDDAVGLRAFVEGIG
jgi:hypothetical protein